jgi:hypothetical protein
MNTYTEDIYYIVKVREDIFDPLWDKTTARKTLCGKLVNQNNGRFYFELNGSGALVIIPHGWIDWMAPSKVLWDLRRKNDEHTRNN